METKTLIAVGLFSLSLNVFGEMAKLPSEFIKAIHRVETGGRIGDIKGDNGAARGPFQIHKSYWADSGVKGNYSQCAEYDYSVKVVTGYLNRYGKSFITAKDYENLARIHNGGPAGHRKAATKNYWAKVQKHLTGK